MLFPLLIANLKIIVRDRQALFWALVFPLIFVVVFGLFRVGEPGTTTVAIVDMSQDSVSETLITNLSNIELLELNLDLDEGEATEALEDGAIGLVLFIPENMVERVREQSPVSPVYLKVLYDESQFQTNQLVLGVIQQFIDQTNMSLQNAQPIIELQPEGIQAQTVEYFDFLLPGLIGMGVMMYAITGMASVVALYRQQKIFRRLLTTPLRVRSFFAAQIIAHLLLSLIQAAIILAAGVFLFNGNIYGNILWVFVLVLFSNIIFLNIGFIVGALAKRVEAANGLGPAIAIPMMFLSGVFFPTENLPSVLSQIVQYLPLTPLLEALRGVAIEAEPLWAYPWELCILGIWIVVTSVVAIRVFKFS
ncbi:ABC transporter permease [Chloroflexota bacterium]